jgi:CRISPR-associated protein Cas8a1/Csx13
MAKLKKPRKPAAPAFAAPDHLTMNLFTPGMSLLHRAGLGGLACTLKTMERQYAAGLLHADRLPSPFTNGNPPWEIGEQSLTLRFGKSENAGDYLKKLFGFAFGIRDGLIVLPGQYADMPPALPVLVAIQEGIQNTFLQHGPTCGSRDGERTVTIEIDDVPMTLKHDVFTSYKHQGWFWLDRDERSKTDPKTRKKLKTGRRIQNHQSFPAVAEGGSLSGKQHDIDNKLVPGGMVRHDRFKESAIRESDAGLICLHFAMVGCLSLCMNRVSAVLLIPEVRNLDEFAAIRPCLTPQSARECKIAGAADAALQAQVRIRARVIISTTDLPACHTMTCRPTDWNKKQKPRVATISVSMGSDLLLDRFERALANLPPQLVVPQLAEQKTKKPKKAKSQEPFWADSVVRPLIAENLALGRPWYSGFVRLMTKINPATDKPYRNQLQFERKGLQDMISDSTMWDRDGEKLVVQAVHEAIRQSLGRIREETDGAATKSISQATKNRWERFREKLRLELAGAKTPAHVRFTLMDLFSRGGTNSVLQAEWQKIVPIVQSDWQLARDLGLLALASYAGKAEPSGSNADEATD